MVERDMPELEVTATMAALLSEMRELSTAAPSLKSLQESIVDLIGQHLPYYDWTGFYMLDPNDTSVLILGPFAGAPTPHVRIPVAQGICGAAVNLEETVIVDDVNSDPRYLSCSIETKSEIVVPIYVDGNVVGEIDIDSHDLAAFTEADRAFLEEAARIVGSYIERHSDKATRAGSAS